MVDYFFGSKQVTPNLVAKVLNDGWMGGRRKILKDFCGFGFVVEYFFGSYEQVKLKLVAKILNDGWLGGRRNEGKNHLADSHHAVL